MRRSESDSVNVLPERAPKGNAFGRWGRVAKIVVLAGALCFVSAGTGCEPEIPAGKDLNLKGGFGAYCTLKRHCRMGFDCRLNKCHPLNRRVLEKSVTSKNKKSDTYRYTGVGAAKVGRKCSSSSICGKRLFCNRKEMVCVPKISCRKWARRIRKCREALWERANPKKAKKRRRGRGRRHRRAVKKTARKIRKSLIGKCKKHKGMFNLKGGRFIAACLSQKTCRSFAKCMFSKPE